MTDAQILPIDAVGALFRADFRTIGSVGTNFLPFGPIDANLAVIAVRETFPAVDTVCANFLALDALTPLSTFRPRAVFAAVGRRHDSLRALTLETLLALLGTGLAAALLFGGSSSLVALAIWFCHRRSGNSQGSNAGGQK